MRGSARWAAFLAGWFLLALASAGRAQAQNPHYTPTPTVTPTATLTPTWTPTATFTATPSGPPPTPTPGQTIRVSLASDGRQANRRSSVPAISADGRYVAFESEANNLDPNNRDLALGSDVYVHDVVTGATALVSAWPNGEAASGAQAAISGDGRWIAFVTGAALAADDTNGTTDVYVYDRSTGAISSVSGAVGGGQLARQAGVPTISADGRYVAYAVSYYGFPFEGQVHWHDRSTGQTRYAAFTVAGQPTSYCADPSISADGQLVAFSCLDADVVPNDLNYNRDIFVFDVAAGQISRVSVASGGGEAGTSMCSNPCEGSFSPAISGDGRFVAFHSTKTNLIADDTNGERDVYVHDRLTRTTSRVSLTWSGGQANDRSVGRIAISRDGNKIVFASWATNMLPDQSLGLYARDRAAQTTHRVSNSDSGATGLIDSLILWPAINADGGSIAFSSDAGNFVVGDTNGVEDVFVRRAPGPVPTPTLVLSPVAPGSITRVSVAPSGAEGNGPALWGAVSHDGRYVAFESYASNLVEGDTNGSVDIFVLDQIAGTVVRASVSGQGEEGNQGSEHPTIDASGRYVAFSSSASNLVPDDTNGVRDVFVRDLVAGTTQRVSVTTGGEQGTQGSWEAAISADGRVVAFTSSAPNFAPTGPGAFGYVYRRDLAAGTTTLISVTSSGEPFTTTGSEPALSADGRFVAFASSAFQTFVYDSATGQVVQASVADDGSPPNGESHGFAISADGRYVAFASRASNLVAGDTNPWADIFVRDLQQRTTVRASVSTAGGQVNWDAGIPAISPDGRYVVFGSPADNLVSGDNNAWYAEDLFLRDLVAGTTSLLAVGPTGQQADNHLMNPRFSGDGQTIVFWSHATTLVAGDTNGVADVFVKRLGAGETRRHQVRLPFLARG